MKSDGNPMQRAHSAPRCTAHTKRTGLLCKSPAFRGWNVCGLHGAGGGAPQKLDLRQNGSNIKGSELDFGKVRLSHHPRNLRGQFRPRERTNDMKPIVFLFASALVLSACGTVTNETRGTINLDGRTYELRTRTMQGSDGSYNTSSVRAKGTWRQCLPASPGSCEAAIRRGNKGSNR